MEMTRERFDALVAELEIDAAENFSNYKLRVLLLAILGYAYIFFILALIVAIIGGLIGLIFLRQTLIFNLSLKLVIPLLLLAGVALRALWVQVPTPEGIELKRDEAPRLFAFIDEVQRAINGPKVDEVRVNDEFNASISQIPRLGIFGWQRNYLTLGLPLLEALTTDEFRAVLAHEMGHLSGAHGRFGAWIYRVRATWLQLLTALEQKEQSGSFVFKRFFEWYAPYFQAYSFVLARRQEYEADSTSASLVGAGTAAATLAKVDVYGAMLAEKFWPSLVDKARVQDKPPDAFLEMQSTLRSQLAPDLAHRWLNLAMAASTGTTDTHPSLGDRLQALGEEPRLPVPGQTTAAQDLFGDTLPGLLEKMNEAWKQSVAVDWRKRHQAMQEKEHRLVALDEKIQSETLTIEERWERGALTEEIRGIEAAMPHYRALLEDHPDNAQAHFMVGRGLLEAGDDAGIAQIENAMQLDMRSISAGCELIYGFLLSQNRKEEAQVYYERGRAQADLLDLAQAERAQINYTDRYTHHQLADEALAKITAKLAEYDEVAEAYLVRKEVQYFPNFPLYVCGIEPKKEKRARSDEANAALSDVLARNLEFPGETFVIVFASGNQRMRRLMEEIEGSRIYP
jgi:Zn-dependent protease with chaperone function